MNPSFSYLVVMTQIRPGYTVTHVWPQKGHLHGESVQFLAPVSLSLSLSST